MPSPFDPQPQPDTPQAGLPSAPQGAPPTTDLAKGWSDWVARPDNRAALMQFGIAMMQPLGLGETPLSHAASAIGQGGEAAQRVQGQEQKSQELESKQSLRESQAQLAEARAATAGSRSDTSAARLDLARERLGMQQQTMDANTRIRAMLGYQAYQKQYAQNALINPAQGPQLSFDEWAAQMGVGSTPQQRVPQSTIENVRAALAANPDDVEAQRAAEVLRKRGVTL